MGLASFEVGDTVVASVVGSGLDAATATELVELVASKIAEGRCTFIVDVGPDLSFIAVSTLRRLVRLTGPSGTLRVWGLDADAESTIRAVGTGSLEVYEDWSSALAS